MFWSSYEQSAAPTCHFIHGPDSPRNNQTPDAGPRRPIGFPLLQHLNTGTTWIPVRCPHQSLPSNWADESVLHKVQLRIVALAVTTNNRLIPESCRHGYRDAAYQQATVPSGRMPQLPLTVENVPSGDVVTEPQQTRVPSVRTPQV